LPFSLVLNKTFQLHHIPNILKIGILFPVFKNKGDCKNAKNYRGITVTPTLSKIIEKILKIIENDKILLNQNPLQKGFTENSSPLLCEKLLIALFSSCLFTGTCTALSLHNWMMV
jgi:hypothetical protein